MDGKKFESLIKESAELQGIDVTRLHDAGSYVGGQQTGEGRRFTQKNICDFILYDGSIMFFVEAKVRKSSLRFDDLTQLPMMKKKLPSANKVGSKIGFLVRFWSGETFWVPAEVIDEFERFTGKKSFNARDCLGFGHSITPLKYYRPKRKRTDRICIESLMLEVL